MWSYGVIWSDGLTWNYGVILCDMELWSDMK